MKRRKIIFVTDYPDILKEWDFSKNKIDPSTVPHGSGTKYWWKCENGHSWSDTVAHRTHDHRGCPYCNNSKVYKGFNDLKSQRPNLLKEWDFENNTIQPDNIYYRSTKKVHWICPLCGQHFLMSPGDRERGQNCPYCARKKVSKGKNDLETLYPEIAKEWNYEKNLNKKPSDYTAHSTIKVWWKCNQGHEWLASIGSRTSKINPTNCPVCSNKKIVTGINDLATTNPEILKYWDYQKNERKPESYSAGSNEYVYWKCEKGHSYRTSIYNFTHSKHGKNCPVCRNFKIIKGINDLATTNPELIQEWNYKRNKCSITDVHNGMNKKVWWIDKFGHEWEATIHSRAINHSGCPYCCNQKVLLGFNDVKTLYPEIVQYWDYEKNFPLKPEDFAGTKSNKKVWFKCKHGHSFRNSIEGFCKGQRCPTCINKIVEPGFNDLATTHPHLAKEWNYELNDDLKPENVVSGSDKKVWWKCEKGHIWQATINSRASGRGCPICSKEQQSSLPEKAIVYYLSKYFNDLKENIVLPGFGKRELDIFIPSLNVGIEYDGSNWHKNVKNDLLKDELCFKNNIKLIRIRENGCKNYDSSSYKIPCLENHGNILLLKDPIQKLFSYLNKQYGLSISLDINLEQDVTNINELFVSYQKKNSVEKLSPEICEQWNYDKNGSLKPSMFSNSSNKKVWWICEHGHEWIASIASRTRENGCKCPICSNHKILKGYNDLQTKFPEIAKEWDYEKNYPLKPDEVIYSSQKLVYWKCKDGHSWKTRIYLRTLKHTKCPVCSGLVVNPGINDLQTLFPEIAKEWDYEKNYPLKPTDIMPGSEKKVWWKCEHGHSYQAIARTRTVLHTGCPICKNLLVVKGVNDLETLHPELAEEWDYEKNQNLFPYQVGGGGGSHKKIWWKCKKCGFSWQASLSSRISLKTGCPKCAQKKNNNEEN